MLLQVWKKVQTHLQDNVAKGAKETAAVTAARKQLEVRLAEVRLAVRRRADHFLPLNDPDLESCRYVQRISVRWGLLRTPFSGKKFVRKLFVDNVSHPKGR